MNLERLDRYADALNALADEIWDYAELAFREKRSAAAMTAFLEKEGFRVTRGLAGMETAYVAECGHGKPVICVLGEYDALDGLSQVADRAACEQREGTTRGHGCGHQLLGVGAIGACLLLRDWLAETGHEGTVRMVGCPAEEEGSGKAYLARSGFFADCDVALSWHPSAYNQIMGGRSQACIAAWFRFHGKAAHAAGAPYHGRSALDAVELMDIGANYLREHIEPGECLHYAITNSGGVSPNVVQSEAEVYYFVRSTSGPKCRKLYDRVINLARGAALMTETTMDVVFGDGLYDQLPNYVLQDVLMDCLNEVGPNDYTEAELAYAQRFKDTVPLQQILEEDLTEMVVNQAETREDERKNPVCRIILQNRNLDITTPGSTDVGDVSWVVPTAQINTACYSYGTPGHSWQLVAQGKSSIAHKGMLMASKVLALGAEKLLLQPELIEKAKEEFTRRLNGYTYESLIPMEKQPPVY